MGPDPQPSPPVPGKTEQPVAADGIAVRAVMPVTNKPPLPPLTAIQPVPESSDPEIFIFVQGQDRDVIAADGRRVFRPVLKMSKSLFYGIVYRYPIHDEA